MSDLVSIYIPTRNRVDMLRAAVGSVLGQSHTEIELIIVDDGSADGTHAYLDQLCAQDVRVRVISHSQSLGACAARNEAIRVASGTFIIGLDDDDEFMPTLIEDALLYWSMFERRGLAISGIYVQVLDRPGSGTLSISRKPGSVFAAQLLDSNLVGNQLFSKREYYLEAGLFDVEMPAWQDWEFFFRLISRFGPARLLDMPLYIFDVRPRPDRISKQPVQRIRQACERMYHLHGNGVTRVKQKLLLNMFSHYYGFRVPFSELIKFMYLGFWPRGYGILLIQYAKGLISS